MTGVNAIFGLLFAVGAGLQLNDPDPARWICMYLAAFLACLCWRRSRYAWAVAGVVAVSAVVWALAMALSTSEWVRPAAMLQPMETHGGPVEEGRELVGLGIIAIWMVWLAIAGWRSTRRVE